jgi:N-acetylglucosamine-6-sulfatase
MPGAPHRRLVAAAFAAVLLGVLAAAAASGCGGGSGRPNVVVVMTDDQTLADLRYMPIARKLIGDEGVDFRDYFISFPTCCPSRATYLSGEYAHNHGVLGNIPPLGGYYRFHNRDALPVWLQRAGYATIQIGKYLNGYGDEDPHEVPPGWTEWDAGVGESARYYWGYLLNHDGHLHRYGTFTDEDPALYQTDVFADKAVDAIHHYSGKRPFFLNVAFLAPHAEGPYRGQQSQRPRPAPRDRGKLADAPLPKPPSFNEADLSDKPSVILGLPRIHPLGALTRRYRARLVSLLAVDDAVKRIVSALDEEGELGNTYLFFTSDNGFFNGEHRIKRGKELPYEPSIRVPLLLRGPGIAAGSVSHQPVANVDLAPTIEQVTGARPSVPQDGESLLPFAEDPGRRTDRAILLEVLAGVPAHGNIVAEYSAVRTRRYLYVEYTDGERELYDLENDPYELRNLASDFSEAATVRRLSRVLARLRHCKGRACRVNG